MEVAGGSSASASLPGTRNKKSIARNNNKNSCACDVLKNVNSAGLGR